MTNEDMLQKVRADRPEQVIHSVLSFEKEKRGLYRVEVLMEGQFFETKVRQMKVSLPYPVKAYEKMSEKSKLIWRWKTIA